MHTILFKRLHICLWPVIALLGVACSTGEPESNTAESRTAAVAMPDSYSAAVASTILESGGNAVDAAVAAAFTLAVTYPESGNIGGGGFMMIYIDGDAQFLDYRETAPLGAHRDMFLDSDGEVIERSSLIGRKAAGVPGTVAGLWAAHQNHGTVSWHELVAPAIRLAEDGFVVPAALEATRRRSETWFSDETNFSAYFSSMTAGENFRQPELAATLRRIAQYGPDDFYRGETAALLVTEMERGDGLITADDLARYEAVWREPLHASWRDYQIVSAPLPSSGGFAVIQLLKMKDYLAHEFEGLEHNSPQYIHLVAEIEKRVFADRAEYFGDPDAIDVPIERLISDEYIRSRAREVDASKISNLDSVQPGLEPFDTIHFSIVDYQGNAVSNTYTLNGSFGDGVIVEGAGFLLNNEMDDFSIKPGVPNMYGVVGGTANEIQPGKRMLSSMSPTILLRDGDIEMVVGTPGGSTIFTSVFQIIVNIYDFGMTPAEAAGASRFHHQLLPPDLITFSPGVPLPANTISALAERGYRARPHGYRFGNIQVIHKDGDQLRPASDPRKRGESRVLH